MRQTEWTHHPPIFTTQDPLLCCAGKTAHTINHLTKEEIECSLGKTGHTYALQYVAAANHCQGKTTALVDKDQKTILLFSDSCCNYAPHLKGESNVNYNERTSHLVNAAVRAACPWAQHVIVSVMPGGTVRDFNDNIEKMFGEELLIKDNPVSRTSFASTSVQQTR